jgi:hypothetical protein
MFINEYDILIDKILDNIYDNEDILKINKINLEKQLRNSKKYIINIDKLNKDTTIIKQLEIITQNIIYAYLICITFLTSENEINDIKTLLIHSKILDSEKLGNIIYLNEELKILISILKEENQEKLVKLYKSDDKYKLGIDILNEFGYENTIMNLKGDTKKHKHNLIKLIIFKRYYRKNFRKGIFELIFTNDEKKKIIEIILPKLKILDYSNIESILSIDEIQSGLVNEILGFYEEYETSTNINISIKNKIKYLFSSKLVIPITDEFLRYHKITEKYEKISTHINKKERENIKDQTKIRYIITKIEKIKDFYSKKIKNNKDLLKEVDKMFYKPLIHRKSIIYNEIEELSIINKLLLLGKKAIDSNEFYHDLLNIRKSSYVNFKDFKLDGFNYFADQTLKAVRYSGIESLENKTLISKNLNVETRTISGTNSVNIVGLFIMSNEDNINKLKFKNIKDIRTIEENGFNATKKVILDKMNETNKFNYYWIFDTEKDNFDQDTFEVSTDNNGFSQILTSKIYDFCLSECYNVIMNKLKKYKKLDLYHSYNLNSFYQKKILKINKNSDYDLTIKKMIYDIIPLNNDHYDEKENTIYGIIGDIHKLPIVNVDNKEIETIYIPYDDKEDLIDLEEENAYCQHSIDWTELSRLRNRNPNKHSELLYNFIKKYVITNGDNEYICKSCKQFVDIQNYLSNPYEGGSSGLDLIITTSKNLIDIKEYTKFSILIKNMDKLVERIAQINNFTYYLGNEQIHKIRRQDIIKQTIDTIILHDKTLRTKNMDKRNRELLAFRNYGVSSDYTFFFIFPLSDDIFKSSSKETDKFKKIKVNNIIAYILLFMILDLNDSQVLMFEFNKICNHLLFTKFSNILFGNLKIKIDNSKKTIPLTELKTLCYILYYTSCMISKHNAWYVTDIEKMKSLSYKQKSIIHTMIDLINSLMEVYSNENENYMYEILASKIIGKIKTVFKNDEILESIKKKEDKKITINSTTNKIQITKSQISSLLLKNNMTKYEDIIKKHKIIGLDFIMNMKMPIRNTDKIMGKEINILYKNYDLDNKIKLAQLYDKNGIFRRFKLSYNEAAKLDTKYFNEMLQNINLYKIKNKIKNKKIISNDFNELKNKYKNITIENNFDLLLKEIEKLNNDTIKIGGTLYNIQFSKLKLNYDYLGNKLQNNFYIQVNNSKIKSKFDKELNVDIYEIFDASNDIKLIYNKYSLHYLGYRQKLTKFTNLKNLNIYAEYIPSIKQLFETLGFKKNYYDFENNKDLKDELRSSITNLKEYIRKFKVFINKLKYKYDKNSHPIIKYYISKIDKLNLHNKNIKIFENIDLILKFQNVEIKNMNNLNKINKYDLLNLTDSYAKLNNYFISELLNLIRINNNKYVKNNLIYFILSVLNLFYFENFNQYNDFDLIRYKQILNLDLLEAVRDEMLYSEDEYMDETTDEQKNNIFEDSIDNDEMNNALDVDSDNDGDGDGDNDVMFHDVDD